MQYIITTSIGEYEEYSDISYGLETDDIEAFKISLVEDFKNKFKQEYRIDIFDLYNKNKQEKCLYTYAITSQLSPEYLIDYEKNKKIKTIIKRATNKLTSNYYIKIDDPIRIEINKIVDELSFKDLGHIVIQSWDEFMETNNILEKDK